MIYNLIKSLLKYFIFGNFFISVCAVVMFWQVKYVFSLNIDNNFFSFIFFSTLCSYSFHWYLTTHINEVSIRLKWTSSHRKFLITLFIISFICAGFFFLHLTRFYKELLLLAFINFMYSAPKIEVQAFIFLRKIAVLKTTYLTIVWVFVTAVLPILVSGAACNYEMVLFTVNRLFLIFPICILFDYRDRVEDSADGIKNIATTLSPRGIDYVFAICMVLNFISVYLFNSVLQNRLYTISLIAPSVLLILTYQISKNSKSDLWYYFYLDGLMMLSGLIVLVSNIL